jgi:hypothetical protein
VRHLIPFAFDGLKLGERFLRNPFGKVRGFVRGFFHFGASLCGDASGTHHPDISPKLLDFPEIPPNNYKYSHFRRLDFPLCTIHALNIPSKNAMGLWGSEVRIFSPRPLMKKRPLALLVSGLFS